MSPRSHIAVVGSGISGLTAAHLLSSEHDVTLFEANDYIGGHTHTVSVAMDDRELQVDTGFIVCNDRNYPNFLKLMGDLAVAYQPTEMSFSVNNRKLGLEYNGHNLNTLFAQRRNLVRPKFIGLVNDIVNFNDAAKRAMQRDDLASLTLDDFIREQGFGRWLRDNYLLPMVAAIWSCSTAQAGGFPLAFFLRFFHNHGLLDIKNRPQWFVLKGGSHSYIEPLTARYRQNILLETPVQSVRRTGGKIEVTTSQGVSTFEHVIFACHSDQALALLADASSDEQDVLGRLAYQANDVVLHWDANLLPTNRRAWASWNFCLEGTEGEADALPVVTYNMNILQGLRSSKPLLVSLNASHLIDPDKVMRSFTYAHPVYSMDSMMAQQERLRICGHRNTHFCGAYWYNGFHEDGVKSALDVTHRFGIGLNEE